MNANFSIRNAACLCAATFAIFIAITLSASAQTLSPSPTPPPQLSPTPEASPTPSLEKQFLKDLLHDQKAIWTSPLKIERTDAKWIIPFAATTALLISTDRRASGEVGNSKDLRETSRNTSYLGSGYALVGAAGTLYLVGRFTGNRNARETGLFGLEAVIDSSILAGGLKVATQRERPNVRRGDGRFWVGGDSFPSGHAISTWALATVIAEEYHDKPLVRFGAYGLATAVSVSRFTGHYHYPSDVVVGSVFGYLIGRYVVKEHGTCRPSRPRPVISPYFNSRARAYGLSASLRF